MIDKFANDIALFLEELRFSLLDLKEGVSLTPQEVRYDFRAMGMEPPLLPDIIRYKVRAKTSSLQLLKRETKAPSIYSPTRAFRTAMFSTIPPARSWAAVLSAEASVSVPRALHIAQALQESGHQMSLPWVGKEIFFVLKESSLSVSVDVDEQWFGSAERTDNLVVRISDQADLVCEIRLSPDRPSAAIPLPSGADTEHWLVTLGGDHNAKDSNA